MRLSVIMDLAVSFADSCKCLPDLWPVIFDGGGIDVSSANDCKLLILSSGIWKCSCTCIDPDCFPLYSSKWFTVLLILHMWGLGCVSLVGCGKVLQESIIIQIHCVKQSLSKKGRDSSMQQFHLVAWNYFCGISLRVAGGTVLCLCYPSVKIPALNLHTYSEICSSGSYWYKCDGIYLFCLIY